MRKLAYLISLFCIVLSGCQRADMRAEPIVITPAEKMAVRDVAPKPEKKDAYQEKSVKPAVNPAVSNEDKSSLFFQAKLDLLRVLICSDEQVYLRDGMSGSDELLQKVEEHFTDMGFRVIDSSPCPDYSSTAATLTAVANQRDVDIYVLLSAKVKQADKFGDFYSFEADGRGKVAQISDKELLTTRSILVRGKRALDEQQAVNSALQKCGEELAIKLTDEILRKAERGTLLRRIEIDGLDKTEQVDYIRVNLSEKSGVKSVALKSWNDKTGRAVFWVRIDASVKENLAAYLERLEDVKLKVDRMDKVGVESHKKELLQ